MGLKVEIPEREFLEVTRLITGDGPFQRCRRVRELALKGSFKCGTSCHALGVFWKMLVKGSALSKAAGNIKYEVEEFE